MQTRKPGATSLVQPIATGGAAAIGKLTLVAQAYRAPAHLAPPAPAKPRVPDDGFPLSRRVVTPASRTRTSTALLHRAFGRRLTPQPTDSMPAKRPASSG